MKKGVGNMLRLALNKNNLLGLLVLMLSVVFAGCGVSETAGTVGSGSGAGTGTVTLGASLTALTVGGTSTITATVTDSSGTAVADGTSISFTMSPTLGTFSSASATTASGVATVTFTAATAGTVTITGANGSDTGNVAITITAAATDPASVALVASATALPVGTTSTITATVLDSLSANVPDGTTVTFTLDIGTLGTITTSSTTTSGIATATFTASSNEGTVLVTATAGGITGNVSITVSGTNTITVTANPTSLTSSGTSSVSATLLDVNAANMPDGTTVTWSVSPATLGTITASSTTVSGTASATFQADSSNIGTATISAASYSVNNSTTITVTAPATGSIAFTSSTPDTIGLAGSGKTTTSTVLFTVLDIYGNTVADGTNVDLCLNGPSSNPNTAGSTPSGSEEYINDKDSVEEAWTDANSNGCFDTGETYTDGNTNGVYDSPYHVSVSTVSGVATAYLNSGSVSGNATIFATVSSSISTSSPTISIGGGLPTMSAFTVAASTLNLPGLDYVGETSTISVYLADRYGNWDVLEGTTVSYYTESGAIVSSSTLDSAGFTSATFRTQNPIPEDVAAETWEDTLLTTINATYGTAYTNHPRDGWANIMVAVVGEESFTDANANNTFDTGETFTDTMQEPFTDSNDDDAWTDGTGADPREIFVDNNGDTAYDGLNAQWDASKTLFQNFTLAITGYPANFVANPNTFTIADAGSQNFTVLIADTNLNYLIGGTTIAVSVTGGGTLTGTTALTLADTVSTWPLEIGFTLTDSTSGDANPVDPTTIEVKVTWKSVAYSIFISGTVD